jgi:hypothetical protein
MQGSRVKLDGLGLLESGIMHDSVITDEPVTEDDSRVLVMRLTWTQPWEFDPYGEPVLEQMPLGHQRLEDWALVLEFEEVRAAYFERLESEAAHSVYHCPPYKQAGDYFHAHFLDDHGQRTGWDLRRPDGDPISYCTRTLDPDCVTLVDAKLDAHADTVAHCERLFGGEFHSVDFETLPACDYRLVFRRCSAAPTDPEAFMAWTGHPFWGPLFSEVIG